MKKILALLLAVVICLSLAACGGDKTPQSGNDTPAVAEAESQMTKEEMLEVATEIGEDFYQAFESNKVSAAEKYLGKVYYLTGIVGEIESEYAVVGTCKVYLPKEEIMTLTKGLRITVVGRLDTYETERVDYGSVFYYQATGTMSNAYFVTDRTEATGYMCFYNTGTYSDCGLDMVKDNVNEVTYSIKHEITPQNGCVTISGTEIKHGTKVTLSGKIFLNTDSSLHANYIINEVELVSIDE